MTQALSPSTERWVKYTLDALQRLAEKLVALRDPKNLHADVFADVAKVLDYLSLKALQQEVMERGEDPHALNPLVAIWVTNVDHMGTTAIRDLKLRPHAPHQWEEFQKTLGEVVKAAKAHHIGLSAPGAAPTIVAPGEPLRDEDGHPLVQGVGR